jgi:hypothetical protein
MDEEQDKPQRHAGMFQPGVSGNPSGREPGTRNRFTELKTKFVQVFEEIGGKEELANWVQRRPRNQETFYRLAAGMLPKEDSLRLSANTSLIDILSTCNDMTMKRELDALEDESEREPKLLPHLTDEPPDSSVH